MVLARVLLLVVVLVPVVVVLGSLHPFLLGRLRLQDLALLSQLKLWGQTCDLFLVLPLLQQPQRHPEPWSLLQCQQVPIALIAPHVTLTLTVMAMKATSVIAPTAVAVEQS